jgi:hypothetical protein
MGGAHVIECEVEHEDINPRFAKDPELPWFDMTGDERMDLYFVQVSLTGDAMDLVVCGSNADMRVKSAA